MTAEEKAICLAYRINPEELERVHSLPANVRVAVARKLVNKLRKEHMSETQQTIRDRIQKEYKRRPCPPGVDVNSHADRESIRGLVGDLSDDLILICPQSRELNHALNKLREAMHWAHDAIDRYGVSSSKENQ